MDCPKCHQTTVAAADSTLCPLCGFDLGPMQQRLRGIYVISFGFFVSTVVYGALVYFMEHQNGFRAPAGALPPGLAYALLVVAVIVFGLATHVLRKRVPTAREAAQLQTLTIVRLALAEAIVMCGLVLYFVGRSVEWFVVFLGLSFLAFLLIAGSMPHVVRRMGELVVAEAEGGAKR
jgi:cytochrome bd-type quinol oxidase subunit 2